MVSSEFKAKSQVLNIELICGDLQSGYFLLQLAYTDVYPDSRNLERLDEFVEIHTNELESSNDKQFFHRLLLSNGSEVQIEFSDVSLNICTKTPQDYKGIKVLQKQSVR